MGSWLSAIVSCTLHHSQGQSKTQGGRSTLRTQSPYTGAAPGVIVLRLARDLPGTRTKTPAYSPSRPWRCPTGHSRKPKSAGRALHVRLYRENLIRALLIFHGLWNRHGQRAFLVSHHRHRGGQPYLQSRAQLLHAHFHAGRRPGECVYTLLSHPLGGAESCHRAQTDFALLLGHGHHPADAETIGDHAKTRHQNVLPRGICDFVASCYWRSLEGGACSGTQVTSGKRRGLCASRGLLLPGHHAYRWALVRGVSLGLAARHTPPTQSAHSDGQTRR